MTGKETQIDVTCPSCGALFGKQNGNTLHIKNRDLYRSIDGGRVWGPCRGCGVEVSWSADSDNTRSR